MLRQEYRALYITDMNVNIWLPELPNFVARSLDGPAHLVKHYKTFLTVHVPERFPIWTDLTPLLLFSLQAPDLRVKFVCWSEPRRMENLAMVLENARGVLEASIAGTLSPQ